MTGHEFDCLCTPCLEAMLERVNRALDQRDDLWLYWIQEAIPELMRLRLVEEQKEAMEQAAWERSERE